LEKLRDITSRSSSVRRCNKIEKIIINDVPAIFLYRQQNVVIFSNEFRNLQLNQHNHFMFEVMGKTR